MQMLALFMFIVFSGASGAAQNVTQLYESLYVYTQGSNVSTGLSFEHFKVLVAPALMLWLQSCVSSSFRLVVIRDILAWLLRCLRYLILSDRSLVEL